jgi:hypothetical protein
MTISQAAGTPQRLHVIDLRTGEDLEVQFNPEQLELSVGPVWKRLEVPGLPHQPQQYVGGTNVAFTLDLYCMAHTTQWRQSIEDFQRFLLSLCYPPAAADSVATGAPPRVMLVWPRFLSMTCIVSSAMTFRYTRWALDGGVTRYVASIPFEEILDVRLSSEDVRRVGLRRAPSAPQG